MMWWAIDYKVIEDAKAFYGDAGFKYIEVPWVVSPGAYNATAPKNGHIAKSQTVVASGEQSFMQLILDGLLAPGKYCCATPCFRPWDSGRSREHLPQFFKVELIEHDLKDFNENVKDYLDRYGKMKSLALEFLRQYVPQTTDIKTNDDERLECTTHVSHDLVTTWGLELGSYGVRSHAAIGYWIYGTGVALPRLTSAMSRKTSSET